VTKPKGYIKGKKLSINEMLMRKQVFWNGEIRNVAFLKRMRMPIYGLAQQEIRDAILPDSTLDRAKQCYLLADEYRKEVERMQVEIKELDKEEERILRELGLYDKVMEDGYGKIHT
jgi:hypothetical protein